MTSTEAPALSPERADLLEALSKQRYFLRYTLRGLSDEQAALAVVPGVRLDPAGARFGRAA